MIGVRPVSYTHLDVYKRQTIHNTAVNSSNKATTLTVYANINSAVSIIASLYTTSSYFPGNILFPMALKLISWEGSYVQE